MRDIVSSYRVLPGAAPPPHPLDNDLYCKAAIFSYIAKESTRDQLRVPLRMYCTLHTLFGILSLISTQ
jgi:hypothetical protein